MKSPWLTGQTFDGRATEFFDVRTRIERVNRMNPEELRAAIAWPHTQKTVRLAAERRLRKLAKGG